MRFLDNVLQDFIDRAPDGHGARATTRPCASARSGSGVMGFHSFLQAQNVPFESAMAKSWNMRMFKHIRGAGRRGVAHAGRGARALPGRRGARRDGAVLATRWRSRRRRRSRSSPATPRPASSRSRPTCSCRRRCPAASPCATGICRSCWPRRAWTTRTSGRRSRCTKGSVQHLDFLTEHEKAVYKTAFELDQRWVIEHAADRTPYHLPEPVGERVPAGQRP